MLNKAKKATPFIFRISYQKKCVTFTKIGEKKCAIKVTKLPDLTVGA
jgi:hypothetical protein